MEKSDGGLLTIKDIYFENGVNYRYFLNWRHALLAGYLVILFVLARAYAWLIENNQPNLVWIVFGSSLFVTICLWGIEYRIRDLYRACTITGHEIEKVLMLNGIYTRLDSQSLIKKCITHSHVLDLFFLIIALGSFAALIISVIQITR